jgi:hypothetical protein
MNYYNYYIYFIIFVKLIFTILLCGHLYYLAKGEKESENAINIEFWKSRTEFIFEISMALLLIYIFSPNKNRLHLIDHETKLLFYILGFILFITSDWSSFIGDSWVLKMIKNEK